MQLPSTFKWKILFFVSYTFVHASLWAEFATQTFQDRETGVFCEGFMGSAEELILPLPIHTICWGFFFPYSHWCENYSRTCLQRKKPEKCQAPSQYEKMSPKMALLVQTNFTRDSLLTLGPQLHWSPPFAPRVLMHVAEKLAKPSHNTGILQLAALPSQTQMFNL